MLYTIIAPSLLPCRALFSWALMISQDHCFKICRACAQMLKVPTMLLVGEPDCYFLPEMWQHLDRHVQNCWLPGMLQNCSHWCPQDR